MTAGKRTAMVMYGSGLAVWKLICHSAVKKKQKLLKGYFITHFKPVPCHLLWLIKIQPKYPWVYNMHFQWRIYDKNTNLSGKESCEYWIFWQPDYFMCRRPISFALDDVLTWAQNWWGWDGGAHSWRYFTWSQLSADIKQEKRVGVTQEWVTETDCGVRERWQAGLWLPHSRGFTKQGTRPDLIDCRNE